MLFCTSLVALAGVDDQPGFSSRHLQIINTKVFFAWRRIGYVSMHFANAHFFQRQSTICELTFPTSILAVKMNRRRLIVVLEEQIFLYDISNMKLLHTIDTRPNPTAICALSPSSENCYVAYPSRSSLASPFMPSTSPSQSNSSALSTGDVELFDALGLSLVNIVQAHKSPVSCMTMNSEGTLLATASEKVLESGLI